MRTLRRWDVALGAALVVAVLCVVGCGGGGGSGSSGAPAPTIATITPDEGPGSGGMTVEITGTGFRDGVVVRFDSSHAGDVEVIDAATLRCRTPAHAPGDVDVSVEYGGDSGNVLADGFTYLPGPTITNVSPQEGSEDGDTLVTLTGADFEAGSLVSFGTAPATEVDVNVAGDTLTCRTPEHAPGFVDITVLSPVSGGAIESNAFEFLPVPEIDTCLPGHGVTAGGTSVTVRGSGFTAVTNVTFDGSDAANVDVYSGTVLTCETPGHAAGPVTVRVENCADAFDEVADGYVYSDNEPPTISSVEPASGPRDAQTDITIIGTGFSGSTVWIDGVAATAVVVVSTEEITCKTPVPGKGGPADVTVKNADSVSTTLDGGFTYWPRWVATANLDSGGVSMMALDEDEGTLTLAGVAGVMGPTRIDAGDGYLFVTSAAGVAMYEIDQETGALTCTAVCGTGGTDPVAALYDSANARLFVTNYGSNSVAVFDVDTLAGTLAPVLGSPFS